MSVAKHGLNYCGGLGLFFSFTEVMHWRGCTLSIDFEPKDIDLDLDFVCNTPYYKNIIVLGEVQRLLI